MTARVPAPRPPARAGPHDEFVDAARSRTAALLVEGVAGIGKTTYAEQVVDAARSAGFRVLGSRAARPDTTLSYSALGDLLRAVTEAELAGIPVPQREALEAALLRRPVSDAVLDPRAVSLATLAVVQGLAAVQPLVVAIDDLQWLDASSARVVGFVLQRLGAEPVGVVVTRRTGDSDAPPLDLEQAMGAHRVTRVDLGPMERGRFGQLLRDRIGPDLPHSVITQVYELVEGNPFYGQQVAREVLRRGLPEPGQPLPLDPDSLGMVRSRFLGLPRDVRSALLPVALSSRLTVDLLRRTVADADVDLALVHAEDEGLVVVRHGGRVGFSHPIFASAVADTATPSELRAAHRRLADVLDTPEERGRHLALSSREPDAEVAAALDLAHQSARRRGAAAAAAELARLAHTHTPEDLEETRWNRAVVAGMLAFESGDAALAHRMLQETLASTPPGPRRADLQVTLCEICWQDTVEVESLALGAIAEPGAARETVAAAHLMLAWAWVYRGDLTRARHEVDTADSLLDGVTSPGDRADLLTARALVCFLRGEPYEEVVAEAVRLEDRLDPAGPADSSTIYSGARVTRGLLALWSGDLSEARRLLEEELARFEALGRYVARDEVLCYLAHLACRTGEWDAAARYADESLDIGQESGHLRGRGQNVVPRAWVSALRGDIDAARRDVAESVELSEPFRDRLAAAGAQGVLGFAELSAGDPEAALPHLLEVCDFLRSSGTTEPGTVPFVADTLEALVATGRLEEAEDLITDDRVMGRCAHGPVPAAMAARGEALVRAALGDLDGAADLLDGVLRSGVLAALPFELGRTLLVAGEVARRARRRPEARRLLEEAHRQFQELGARLWEARAAAELERAAAEPGAVLTATEGQIAALVAEGLTNREVADRLFLSVKTVEANLSRVYRKLGLRSRADLARRALTDAAASPPP